MLKEKVLENKLAGTVLIDETFVGGKNKNRHWDKKVKQSQGRSFKDKTPVLGILEQEIAVMEARPHKVIANKTVMQKTIIKPAKLFCKVIANTQARTIKPILYQTIERDSIIVTDEWQAYDGLNGIYEHHVVNHKLQQYSSNGFSSNGVENAWSIFKRTIIGTYHQVTRRHLHRYVAEFTFRYNNRSLVGKELLNTALMNLERRLTWKQLLIK